MVALRVWEALESGDLQLLGFWSFLPMLCLRCPELSTPVVFGAASQLRYHPQEHQVQD